MDEDKFIKKRWKGYEEVEYHNERQKNVDGGFGIILPCMVVSVDFDERLLKLQPFPNELYEDKDFWAHCSHIELPKKEEKSKMKISFSK